MQSLAVFVLFDDYQNDENYYLWKIRIFSLFSIKPHLLVNSNCFLESMRSFKGFILNRTPGYAAQDDGDAFVCTQLASSWLIRLSPIATLNSIFHLSTYILIFKSSLALLHWELVPDWYYSSFSVALPVQFQSTRLKEEWKTLLFYFLPFWRLHVCARDCWFQSNKRSQSQVKLILLWTKLDKASDKKTKVKHALPKVMKLLINSFAEK